MATGNPARQMDQVGMIPLVLFAGFPGAGKTRLIADLARQLAAKDLRVRILLHQINEPLVDAARLADLDAHITVVGGAGGGRLGGGGGASSPSLSELLNALALVPDEPGSVLHVEVSGTIATDALLAHIMADQRLAHLSLPLQVTVVDTARWQMRGRDNEIELSQASTATHLHLNRIDEVDRGRVDQVTRDLRQANPQGELVDPARLSAQLHAMATASGSASEREMPVLRASARSSMAHSLQFPFESLVFGLPDMVNREAFESFFSNLPESVVRAKGFVRFEDSPKTLFVWDASAGRSNLNVAAMPETRFDPQPRPSVVFVGKGLAVGELAESLAALAAEPGKG